MTDSVLSHSITEPEPLYSPQGASSGFTEENAEMEFLRRLLGLEVEIRGVRDREALALHLCNATRELLRFEQSFYGAVKVGKSTFTLKAVSSVPVIDRNAPFVNWFESLVNNHILQANGTEQQLIDLTDIHVEESYGQLVEAATQLLWTPQLLEGRLIGGFITARRAAWTELDRRLTSRLADAYLHASAAIGGESGLLRKKIPLKPASIAILIALLALAFLPVRITALSPVEVTPKDPYIITAPFDGVVRTIRADQGQVVSAGVLVVEFDDVHLNNRKLLAEQKMAVAQARYDRTSQGAIADFRVKREIEVARTEYELAKTESDYAARLYEQSRLTTPIDGVAIYSDRQDWEGKPVSAGEAILSIANPTAIEFTIDLPVKDSLVLEKGADVRVFLDSSPLEPLDATLTKASYSAEPDKRNVLSYRVQAELPDNSTVIPRIGVQGTALVYGERTTLGYAVFRRPYSALRQLIGW